MENFLEKYKGLKVLDIKVENYERVVKVELENEFIGYIAIHNTSKGPALGGCRCWHYIDTENAFSDVLSLSKAMSYKNCMANLNFGGGKSVINTPNYRDREKKLYYLEIMGHVVEALGGKYIIAEDMNVSCEDLDVIRPITQYVASKVAGDPGPVTAEGVFLGIHKLVPDLLEKNPEEISVMVQGVGSVGSSLVEKLLKAGYNVYMTDINCDVAKKFPEAIFVDPNDMFSVKFDVFSPCAFGGVINQENVDKLIKNNTKVIAGSANNQLSYSNIGWKLLENRIIYMPDFIINSGGVIQVAGVHDDGLFYDHSIVEAKLYEMTVILKTIIEESKKKNLPTNYIAVNMAREKLKIID